MQVQTLHKPINDTRVFTLNQKLGIKYRYAYVQCTSLNSDR